MKRIGAFEQHVDKALLGVCGLAALGIMGYQILVKPNEIKVGTQQLSPESAMRPVEEKARTLLAKVESTNPPTIPEVSVDLSSRFEERMRGLGVTTNRLASLGDPPKAMKVSTVGPVADGEFVALNVPIPTGVIAATIQNTIDPREPKRYPELAAFLPAAQPMDKASVSIEATFSGTSLLEALESDPDGEGPALPLPRSWWSDPLVPNRLLVNVIRFEVEREVVAVPAGVGVKVGETTTLSQIPGRFDGESSWKENVKSLGDVGGTLDRIAKHSEEIQRPKYYERIAGLAWDEPSSMAARALMVDQQREIDRLKRELTSIDKKILDIQERLKAAGAAAPLPGGRPTPPRDPRGGGGGGGGGGLAPAGGGGRAPGGGGGGGSARPPRDPAPAVGNPAVLQQSLNREIAKRQKVVDRLRELGEDVGGESVAPTSPQAALLGDAILNDSEVKMWAHDLTAVPGVTYKYRCRVVLNNPLFDQALPEKSKRLGRESLVRSEWSGWSPAVTVDPNEYFAMTSAQTRDQLSSVPKGTAELFKFYYGWYRKATVSVEPGDPISGVVRLAGDFKAYDISKFNPATEPEGEKPSPAAPAPGGNQPGGLQPGGLQPGGLQPGGLQPSGTFPPGGERGWDPGRGVPPGGDVGVGDASRPALDPLGEYPSEVLPSELSLEVPGVIFLDAKRLTAVLAGGIQGSARESILAVLRNAAGMVISRNPESDKDDEAYLRIKASADMGVREERKATAPADSKPGSSNPGIPPAPIPGTPGRGLPTGPGGLGG
ncbi:MAG: hypothetical protein IPK69_09080 [Phycisphaerales bacterium]|nr:MAG: hypothetical protein IPK69_09080 [Phycisphaerales bacterium]